MPVTVITCEMSEATLRELIARGHPCVAELAAMARHDIVELPTGHWPMFTKRTELAASIVAGLPRT